MAERIRNKGGGFLDLVVATGAGVYWASVILQVFSMTNGYHNSIASLHSYDNPRIINLTLVLLFCLIAVLLYRRFDRGRSFRVLAAVSLASGIAMLALSSVFAYYDEGLSNALTLVLYILRGISFSLLMLLWGLVFCGMDKWRAVQTVTLTTLVMALVFFAVSIFPRESSGITLMLLMPISSTFLLLVSKGLQVRNTVAMNVQPKKELFAYYLSRIVFGVLVGVLSSMSDVRQLSEGIVLKPVVAVSAILLLCVGVMLVIQIKHMRLGAYLPIMLVGLGVALVSPFLGFPQAMGVSTWIIAWFAWIVLSSVQLSEVKHRFGMPESLLNFTEKAVVIFCWLIGALIGPVINADLMFLFDYQIVSTYLFFGFAFLILLFSAGSMLKLLSERDHEQLVKQVVSESEEQLAYIYGRICEDYRLTKREAEVFVLLAKGHTRVYICKKLNISDGTAKSHIGHIYEKLGFRKKEGVLELVEKYKREMRR